MNRLLLCCLLSTSALAQKDEPRRRAEFDAPIAIEGELVKPVSTYVPVRMPTQFPNLIKIRGSFAPELQKSVDRL